MQRKLKIFILEDEIDIVKKYKEYVKDYEGLEIVEYCNNSYIAKNLIEQLTPDVLILDLELIEGSGSGLQLLKEIKNSSLPVVPYILVVTHNVSNVTLDVARNLGADYVMSKFQKEFTEKSVLDFLIVLKETIINKNSSKRNTDIVYEETVKEHKDHIKKRIITEIEKVGVSRKMKGFVYLCEAIELLIENSEVRYISREISKKHANTTSASIDRAMQNAINKAWSCCGVEDLLKNFTAKIQSDKGVPTVTEFIYYYSSKIKNNV